MQFDRNKLKTVILHVCKTCPPDRLGAVKFHKILYFLDMLRYIEAGQSVTGCTYSKRPFGPTSDQLLRTLKDMARDGEISERQVDYHGFIKREYLGLKEPEMFRLNDEERALLDDVMHFVCLENSARTISELSHNRPWEMVEFGEQISYRSAFMLIPSQVSQEAFDTVEQGASEIAAAQSANDTVAPVAFAAFRSRVLAELGQG